MNSSGFIRGYMARNMTCEGFIKIIVEALSKEFGQDVQFKNADNDSFLIRMADYKIIISKEDMNKLKSPYGIDKFILEQFENQGFKFDRNRSQYIRYCFGNIDIAMP